MIQSIIVKLPKFIIRFSVKTSVQGLDGPRANGAELDVLKWKMPRRLSRAFEGSLLVQAPAAVHAPFPASLALAHRLA